MKLPKAQLKKCVLCESTNNVQRNHLGGQNHFACFTMLFCEPCHHLFHAMVESAGTDLTYTPDRTERIRRAFEAIKVAEWMLLQQLKSVTNAEGEIDP